ncbi:MAG: twin-arginine translocation signal domain-containing protein [archaeon]|nr:twin-arginine translocation signal domain-containing protein [archaeon]MCR4323869.1 twin-arginine translocation signal domain-containing protein [Nanoarchaeota archaeon]
MAKERLEDLAVSRRGFLGLAGALAVSAILPSCGESQKDFYGVYKIESEEEIDSRTGEVKRVWGEKYYTDNLVEIKDSEIDFTTHKGSFTNPRGKERFLTEDAGVRNGFFERRVIKLIYEKDGMSQEETNTNKYPSSWKIKDMGNGSIELWRRHRNDSYFDRKIKLCKID